MKACPYCFREHDRRGRACSDECERHIRAHISSIRSGRRRAVSRIRGQVQATEQHKRRWRDITFDRNRAANLKAIFGVEVDDA